MMRFAKIFVILCFVLVGAIEALADTTCIGYKPTFPDHYCDCKNNITRLGSLPFDVQVTDSMWFKASSDLFISGFTAYLYSDCDVNFDIYQNCTSSKLLYSVVIPKNQARDVTAESIKQKLEEAGMSAANMALYICVYPVGGEGGRLMCYPYNTGYNSTCSDVLSLLPGMTFVSSHAEDVYEISSENIADSYAMYLQWSEESDGLCNLSITRGSCNGEVVAEFDFVVGNSLFHFDRALLMDVKAKGEKLYAHFSHDASVVGRISFSEVAFEKHLTDTVICQGKEFRYQDFVTSESGRYYFDTVRVSPIKYELYGYNIVFSEPELKYDTLVVKKLDLPYNYRGQYVIPTDGFGSHDVTIHNDGECDEHVSLFVRQKFATVVLDQDTTLCHGKTFSYGGKKYVSNVTFIDSVWNNVYDTLYLNRLNVYFSPADIIYDTLALTKKEVAAGKRYEGITIRAFGDYKKVVYDELLCMDSLYLHVCHKVTNVEQALDTSLCAGDVYVHGDGVEYTVDVTLVDSVWKDDDTRIIKTTKVHFIVNKLAYDTLYLGYSELPYLYKEQAEITQIADTIVSVLEGKCLGPVQLHIVHKYATLVTEQDTTLCEGKVYEHRDSSYIASTTIVDSVWINSDTMVVTTTRLYFATPEVEYDTLALRVSELPYDYRGAYTIPVDGFGSHDVKIHKAGECDENIKLYVSHLTATITTEQDTTLCEGKVYEHRDSSYIVSTTIVDSVWINSDTMVVTTTRLYFVTPEMKYDALALRVSELPYDYRGAYTIPVDGFGSHEVKIHKAGECDENIKLYVSHLTTTITTEQDTTLCEGKVYEHRDSSYIVSTTIVDSVWLNRDTMVVTTTRLYFATPEVEYDTLALRASELPYDYRGKYTIPVDGFGSHDVKIHKVGECDENIKLYVSHLTTTIITEQDTTLCEGKVYEYKDSSYFESTTIVDSVWLNRDTLIIGTTNLYFTMPETEYDTVFVSTLELRNGYYYELAEDYVYSAGVYDYEITAYDECTRKITLMVIEKVQSSLDDILVAPKSKLIMIDGVIYILRDGVYYTLMGVKVNISMN